MSDFESLTLALEEWFDKPLGDLPEALRLRVEQELKPLQWEVLAPEQRRTLALQLDYQNDPATEKEREDWWVFFNRMSELEAELSHQRSGDRVNLDDLLNGTGPLKDLREQIQRMKARERHAKDNYYPQRRVAVRQAAPGKYVAYSRALQHLRQRLKATPEELAAWVWLGPDSGGLAAYLNVNELDPPPRFHFGAFPLVGLSADEDAHSDYVAPLMGCWFRSDDIEHFQPAERFLTGKALIQRWSSAPDLRVEHFIQARVGESRLAELHPIYGMTQASIPHDGHLPPMVEGLFRLADVEAIEAEDFAAGWAPGPVGSGLVGPSRAEKPAMAANPDPVDKAPVAEPGMSTFRDLKDLLAEELTFAFVGDRTEGGLAGNNMLEISARGISRRVGLAQLDLMDRRTGSLNSQGAILIGLYAGRRVPYSEANSKKVSRLRQVIRHHLGCGEPFRKVGDGRGWEPRFAVVDRRGAADSRARDQGERRTISLDRTPGLGVPNEAGAEPDRPFEAEGDDADAWLRTHGSGDSA